MVQINLILPVIVGRMLHGLEFLLTPHLERAFKFPNRAVAIRSNTLAPMPNPAAI
jgi:hypothetical protein